MAGLTEKNKRAIDVYLGAGSPEAKGSGGKAWQEVYGTKSLNAAETNWARMLRKAQFREYLEQRQTEINEAVKERVVFDKERAINDLVEIQGEARQDSDHNAAIKATVEAGRFAGIYVDKSERQNVNYDATAEDRMWAAAYGYGLAEYLERKAQNKLPPPPELPGAESLH